MTDQNPPGTHNQQPHQYLREPPLPTLSQSKSDASYEESGDMGPLWAALAKAQGAFEPIETTRESNYSGRIHRYAELGEILAKTRPALVANGLCLIQPFHGIESKVLTTKIAHASGASLTLRVGIPDTQNPQALGSFLTYLKKYSVTSLLSVASEEDDDGNEAAGTGKQTHPRQDRQRPPADLPKPTAGMNVELKKRIFALSKEAGFNNTELRAFAARSGVDNLEQATDEQGGAIVVAFEKLMVKR